MFWGAGGGRDLVLRDVLVWVCGFWVGERSAIASGVTFGSGVIGRGSAPHCVG